MEKEKPIFVGNLTQRQSNYWDYFTGSINLEEIKKHDNWKGYAKIKVQLRREPWKYGETHSIIIDTWKPTPKPTYGSNTNIEDVPF